MANFGEVMDAFERDYDRRKTLRTVLANVPSAERDIKAAIENGSLTSIRYAPLNGSNGTYDFETKTLTLNSALKPNVDDGNQHAIFALAYIVGHEGSHAARGTQSLAHTGELRVAAVELAQRQPGPHDYTALGKRHVEHVLTEEATAEIGGFNAVVGAMKWKGGEYFDFKGGLEQIASYDPSAQHQDPSAVALGQLSRYVEIDAAARFGGFKLKEGLRVDDNGFADPTDALNIAFMKKHFSDQRIDNNPSLDQYYRHKAVADVVRGAIAGGEAHADIGLDLTELGARRECFADKFRNQGGQPVQVAFRNLAENPLPPPVVPVAPQQSAHAARVEDAVQPEVAVKSSKRRIDDNDIPLVDNDSQKQPKPGVDPGLVRMAKESLERNGTMNEIAKTWPDPQDQDRIVIGCAAAAQKAGMKQIGEIAVVGGNAWVCEVDAKSDYGAKASVNLAQAAKMTEAEHAYMLPKQGVEQAVAISQPQPQHHHNQKL